MALWLIRAGRYGQHEQQFLDDNRVYLTWAGLDQDLSKVADRDALKDILRDALPDATEGHINNGSGQVWAFVRRMEVGDWVILPSKKKSAIHVAEIAGEYVYDSSLDGPTQYRRVKWIGQDIPRSNFDQDLLYSFGAFMTICQIKRNDAEARVRAMVKTGRKTIGPKPPPNGDDDGPDEPTDLARLARDGIAKVITRRFMGHGLARLVAAVLEAEGYTTHVSGEGPDKGVDILAAPGPLGFGSPRLCVQVKSGDAPVDRPTLDQLIGVMRNFRAEQGLLVSWGGFRSSVDKETASQFFQVRLWDADALIEELLEQYDRLPAEIRAELPLKRIWTVASQDEDA